jgi:enediyne biosynthesis protein E4
MFKGLKLSPAWPGLRTGQPPSLRHLARVALGIVSAAAMRGGASTRGSVAAGGSSGLFSRHGTRLVALCLVVGLYGFARLPEATPAERSDLAARFAFTRAALPELPEGTGPERRTIRPVHPSLRHIAAWISSVGAGVALHDIDGDGLPNDACTTDPRVDLVLVSPVPGTGERYPLFALDPAPLRFERATMAPMGCLPGDWNEDGRTDLLVYYWGRPPIAFLRLAGGPPTAAAWHPVDVAPASQRWYTNALTSADVDGDGHLDLIVGNYFPDGAAILDARAAGHEGLHSSMSRSQNGGTNRLLLWRRASAGARPAVEFADVPQAFDPQTTSSWTLAVGAADLDGDLRPEIYFGNDFGNDRLLHNRSRPGRPHLVAVRGVKGLTDPTSKVLGRDSFKGMGVDFADLNGDGMLDLYVSNIAQNWALEESHFVWLSAGRPERLREGIAPYSEASEDLGLARSGWGWDARFADFDNDGVLEAMQAIGFIRGTRNRWPELHEIAMGNDGNLRHPAAWHRFAPGDDLSGHLHNPFFVRAADGRYYDVAAEVGIADSFVSRGLGLADVDGDGDLDFAVANQWDRSWFYRNDARRPGAALVLDLRLPAGAGTRPAVGATATVHFPDGSRRSAEVDGGSGHSGKRAPQLHFGLGATAPTAPTAPTTALRVDLRWRDPGGRAHGATLRLTPGWHTLRLAGGVEPLRIAHQSVAAVAAVAAAAPAASAASATAAATKGGA